MHSFQIRMDPMILASLKFNKENLYACALLYYIGCAAAMQSLFVLDEKVVFTPDRGQSKTLILSTNVDKNLLEKEFLIAICRATGDKWLSKTFF